MKNKKLVIIDGNSFIFRAFYATFYTQNLMRTKEGMPTNALFGYINFVESIIKSSNPDYLFVALDKGSNTFRKKLYSDYKAHRDSAPNELISQFKLIRDYMDNRNIVWLESDDFEADDIVGSISEKFASDVDVEIYTGDRDYLQLVRDNVQVSIIKKGGLSESVLYSHDLVVDEYGVDPIAFIDLKAICGDKSDNIPGIAGIGEKTALKYLLKYKTLENLYEEIESEKQTKTRDKFISDKENALLSKVLSTIKLDIDFDLTLEDLSTNLEPSNEFLDFLQTYELKSLEKRFFSNAQKKVIPKKEVVFDQVHEKADFVHVISSFEESYHFNSILYVIYQIGDNCYVSSKVTKELLQSIIDENTVVFDGKKLNSLLQKFDIDYIDFKNDLMLMSYVVDSEKAWNSISKYSQMVDINVADEKVWKKELKSEDEAQVNLFVKEQSSNVLMFMQVLLEKMTNKLKQQHLITLYQLELDLARVLFDMEQQGICFNEKTNDNLLEKIQRELDKLQIEIHDYAGEEFNINSPKQLGEVLFVKMGLEYPKKNPKSFSTSVDILEKIQFASPIISLLLEYRKLNKLTSTYLKAFSKFVTNEKIHTIYNQVGTTTGRLSSNYPNLQNIPIRSEIGKQVREAFEPSSGKILVSIDYSQIELRVIAALANEENMLNAFNVGYDIHKDTAANILGVEYDQVTPEQRKIAKAINFGIIYGMGPYKLAQDLNITRKDATDFIERYLHTYSSIAKYIESTITQAKLDEFVTTHFNRKRYLKGINDRSKMISSLNERVAINSPIQGTAADILKMAMVAINKEINNKNINAKLLLQIHDELVFEVDKDGYQDVVNQLVSIMESVVDLGVKLECNYKIGDNWYLMKGN